MGRGNSISSCRSCEVLVDESAEHVTSTDLLEISRLLIDQFRDVRRSQVEAAMWTMCVVVAEVGTKHLIEMSTAEDERVGRIYSVRGHDQHVRGLASTSSLGLSAPRSRAGTVALAEARSR